MSILGKAILLVVLGLIGGGTWYFVSRGEADKGVSYRIATVSRGEVVATIGATGTVEPEEVVDVGAQVAGQINSFGKDKSGKTVDYGSIVEEGTILAEIDQSLYNADAAQAKAQLEQAKAGVVRAKADLEQMKAKLAQAQRDWERAQKLGSSEALAQTQYDAYRYTYETAKANVDVGEAAIVQAQTSIAQAEAGLQRAQRNLSYTTIKSPVKGVIIDRRVNIGQTVVASLNAPSLFLIAKDLRRMQVWVPVNEADIGSIHPGQPVNFTVDAYPGQTFKGEVGKIRLNASSTQNVVTYTVEVITDNSNGKLLPYLTANVQFEIGRSDAVLTVPNAALRYSPQAQQVAPEFRGKLDELTRRGGRSSASASTPAEKEPATEPAAAKGVPGARRHGTLWVQQGEFVRPLRVQTGLTDGSVTEVRGEGVAEGMEVVIGQSDKASADQPSQTTNPFQPQFRRPGGSGGARGGR